MRAEGWATLVAMLAFGAAPAQAEKDLSNMTPEERAVFGHEIRETLLTLPQLLPGATPPAPAEIYADEIARDLALINAAEDALFGPGINGFGDEAATHRIALFTASGCAVCKEAEAELRDLADRSDLRVTLIDMEENEALTRDLGIDIAPSYVMETQIIRGHMPLIVLERYLSD